MRKCIAFILVLCTVLGIAAPALAADDSITLLFTSDIHSNTIPHLAWTENGGMRLGGFARLKTAVDNNYAHGKTLLLDSGDFSMGTLYQNYTRSDALELSIMSNIGYDAVAFGNHDFDIGEDGLRDELTAIYNKGSDMSVLCSNLRQKDVAGNPLGDYGVSDYAIIERNGFRIGVFALMGEEADEYTTKDQFYFEDTVETAKAMVSTLENENVDLIIALSHSGITPDMTFDEDARIAEAVDGIDIILSGHYHKETPELITVNDTYIACAGTALNYLGRIDLKYNGAGWEAELNMIRLDESIEPDPEITALLSPYTDELNSQYLEKYGAQQEMEDVYAYSPYDFRDGDYMEGKLDNYAFGGLLADSYMSMLKKLGLDHIRAAAVPVGTVRAGLYSGELTVADVYNVLSYGASPLDRSSGAPIVTFCLTGRELYDVCEASVSLSPYMYAIQMFFSGVRYVYHPARPILNKVYAVELLNPQSGAYEYVERSDDVLYTFACSWTTMESISLMESTSFGLMSVKPKDEQGNVLETEAQLKERIVHLENSNELKEWYALYDYIGSMDENDDGLPEISSKYAVPAEFVIEGGGISNFFVNNSRIGLLMYGIVALAICIIALIIWHYKKKRAKKSK